MGWVTKKKYAWMVKGGEAQPYKSGLVYRTYCVGGRYAAFMLVSGVWHVYATVAEEPIEIPKAHAGSYGEALVKFKLMV